MISIQNVITIELNEAEAKILEKRILERDRFEEQVQVAKQTTVQLQTEAVKAQGRLNGIVEMIAEGKGHDFTKAAAYDIDTKQKKVVITFAALDESENGKVEITLGELETEHAH